MRAHVGKHILISHYQLKDPELRMQTDSDSDSSSGSSSGSAQSSTIGAQPCGWCGLEDANCKTQLIRTVKKKKGELQVQSSIESWCEYRYNKMQYKAAATVSKSSPCTNVPMHCPICPLTPSGQPHTVWKYNARFHLLDCHREVMENPPVPNDIWRLFTFESHITREEEQYLGIEVELSRKWRRRTGAPDSDALQPSIDMDSENAQVQPQVPVQRPRTSTVTRLNPRGITR